MGQGRAWPLLTGERAHYELAAGRDVTPFLKAIDSFANNTGLLSEQIWDAADASADLRLRIGRPTGSAMRLMWAHAEYIKLLRSVQDGSILDRIHAVACRYGERRKCSELDIWKFNRQITRVAHTRLLRIQARAPFQLRFSTNGWQSQSDRGSTATGIGVHYCDISPDKVYNAPVQFTFYWTDDRRWEGRDYRADLS